MNRLFRMRRYNPSSITDKFDFLFPQTLTENILRSEDGGVLESDLLQYDRHLENNSRHINRALSDGTARALFVRFKDTVLTDGFPLLLTLHIDLECEPTLKFNDGEAYPIVTCNGSRIPGGQIAGSVIFLVWSEPDLRWYLLSAEDYSDITKVVLPVDTEYVYEATSDGETLITIPKFDKKSNKIVINYGQTILRANMDYEFLPTSNNTIRLIGFGLQAGDQLVFTITSYITTAKRGHFRYDLETKDYTVSIKEDGTSEIPLPLEALDAHSVVINYNQTILRNNLDYVYTDAGDKIILKDFVLNAGEDLIFSVTEFVEANGELVPNNWGATGNYRYSLNVVHTNYTATEDRVSVISVPGFNYRRDDISVIQDNKLFIYDVDYTIDEIGNIVLLKTALNTGDEIFFTILQGAMMDVPNFNVIQANGYDGQHILLDMSYSVLVDFYTLLVRLKHDLKTAPTVKCIDGPAEPVCDCFGTPIPGGYKKGSYLWLVYSEPKHQWYSLSHSQLDVSTLIPQHLVASGDAYFTGQKDVEKGTFHETVIAHGLGTKPEKIDITPCEPPTVLEDGTITSIGDIWSYADETNLYVGNSGKSVSKFKWTVSTEDATNDLRSYIDKEITSLKSKPGNIMPYLSTYTATTDGVTEIQNISNFNAGVDKIIVNLNQTVLRENIDFKVNASTNGISLITFKLAVGDILQFTVLKQDE